METSKLTLRVIFSLDNAGIASDIIGPVHNFVGFPKNEQGNSVLSYIDNLDDEAKMAIVGLITIFSRKAINARDKTKLKIDKGGETSPSSTAEKDSLSSPNSPMTNSVQLTPSLDGRPIASDGNAKLRKKQAS